MSKYVVTEGISGYWRYHLSRESAKHFSLCGQRTMHTSIPIEKFGVGRAAPEGASISGSWCEECKRRSPAMTQAASRTPRADAATYLGWIKVDDGTDSLWHTDRQEWTKAGTARTLETELSEARELLGEAMGYLEGLDIADRIEQLLKP